MESVVLSDLSNRGVLTLTMNRPQARNALSEALMAGLAENLDRAAKDRSARVVVLRANGPAFCAGHDLKEMNANRTGSDKGEAYFRKVFRECSAVMQAIVHLPKPVIAEVHGIATAAGCQLVASCDLAIASDTAKFATPGVNIGLFCSTPMVALSRNLSRKHAMEMLLTGDMVSAQDAATLGLINRAVPAEKLADETRSLAEKIAGKATAVLTIGKEAFYRQLELGLTAAYDYASEVMTRNMLAPDAEEGISAFVNKRDPKWTS
jgi:enoyl-CoA hydratase/carnithine racemase